MPPLWVWVIPGMAKLDGGTSDKMLSMLPLGRMQHPWDIAIAAVFLASAAGRCVSGDTLVSRCGPSGWPMWAVVRANPLTVACFGIWTKKGLESFF